MALPLPLIIAAATKLAQDERAQRVAKSLFDAGSDAVQRRLQKRRDKPVNETAAQPKPEDAFGVPKKAGWRAGMDRKIRFRKGASGDLIRFRYTDEHGLVTQRMVGNWTSDGDRLTGFCLNMKSEQSFQLSGIADAEEVRVVEPKEQ